MKTFPGASSQSTPGFRKKRSRNPLPDEIYQIAHQLFNQLSVINLCSFKLQDKLQDTLSCSGKTAGSLRTDIDNSTSRRPSHRRFLDGNSTPATPVACYSSSPPKKFIRTGVE